MSRFALGVLLLLALLIVPLVARVAGLLETGDKTSPVVIVSPPVTVPPREPVEARAEKLIPEDLLISRAEPSVFKIIAIGDVEVTLPQRIGLTQGSNELTLLENEYARDNRDGMLTTGTVPAEYFWGKIVENPEKYLSASSEDEALSITDGPYASGTTFAVSRDGVFLTNAHVVENTTLLPKELPEELLIALVGLRFRQLRLVLGAPAPSKLLDPIIESFGMWLALRSRVNVKFKEAQIVLKFDYDPEDQNHLAKVLYDTEPGLETLRRLFPLQKMRWVAPVDILTKGEVYPGEDVAVLKLHSSTEDWQRQIISLLLGDSSEVVNGTSVWAMGFPGAGFSPHAMQVDAEFRVSNHPGHIGQTKLMQGGWDAFEMDADINHGDSGGPVINRRGEVIGINVAGPEKGGISGINLAVPINVAKKYLAQAGVTPDPGPLSVLWEEGLQLYTQGHYQEAREKFVGVKNIQSPPQPDPYLDVASKRTKLSDFSAIDPSQSPPWQTKLGRARDNERQATSPRNPYVSTANPYVIEMITRCDTQLAKSVPLTR